MPVYYATPKDESAEEIEKQLTPELSVDISHNAELKAQAAGSTKAFQNKHGRYQFFKRGPAYIDVSKVFEMEVACNLLYGWLLGFDHVTDYRLALENGKAVGTVSKKIDNKKDLFDFLRENPDDYEGHFIPEILLACYLMEEADFNPCNFILNEATGKFVKIDHVFSGVSVSDEDARKIYVAMQNQVNDYDIDEEYVEDIVLDEDVGQSPFKLRPIENFSNVLISMRAKSPSFEHLQDSSEEPQGFLQWLLSLFQGEAATYDTLAKSENLHTLITWLIRHVKGSQQCNWVLPRKLEKTTVENLFMTYISFCCLDSSSVETVAKLVISNQATRDTFVKWFMDRQETVRNYFINDEAARDYLIQNESDVMASLEHRYSDWCVGLSERVDNARLDPAEFLLSFQELVEASKQLTPSL